ncbi:hypothetical protein BOX15_Mlig021613g3 [Macrostomum lignano]|uniref:Uncharacterized protein n=2 Tax=Macrostomum lignano TaxID=282301 RepID=A0A267DVM5_9PLAT|nr:hypothetical protein BOX15_Mlig021613g3 [Macrostomum lignano]
MSSIDSADTESKQSAAASAEPADAKDSETASVEEPRKPVVFKMPQISAAPVLNKKLLKQPQQKQLPAVEAVETETQSDNSSDVNQTELEPKQNKVTQQQQQQEGSSYIQPHWGGRCQGPYSLQVLKSGVEVQNLDLQGRSCLTIGRQSDCDLRLEHPSLSRHHAVMQYSGAADSASESEQTDSTRYPSGWYLIDLGSTHGTLVNKVKLPPQQYRRLRVGHVIRLAGSTRLLVLQGPESDQEAESELTYTQLKERRDRRRIEQQMKQNAELQSPSERDGNSGGGGGCTWGFAEDAVDEAEESAEQQLSGKDGFNSLELSAAAQTAHTEAYLADPLKFLRGWYDRQGLEAPSFKVEAPTSSGEVDEIDVRAGRLLCCRLELPVDGPDGRPETAEAPMPPGTRKRDAIAACALAACQLLDRMGELDADAGSGSAGSSRERRLRQLAENDFYEEDEDAYLDRTGQLEAKRRARMAAAAAAAEGASKAPSGSTAVTFDQLTARCQALDSEIADLEAQLEAAAAESASRKKSQQQQQQQANSSSNQLDELEEYMRTIKSGGLDQRTRTQMRLRLMAAKKEAALAHRMLEKARPADLSSVGAATKAREQRRIPMTAPTSQVKQPEMQAFTGEEVESDEQPVVKDDAENAAQHSDCKVDEDMPQAEQPLEAPTATAESGSAKVEKFAPIRLQASAKTSSLAAATKKPGSAATKIARPAWLDEADETPAPVAESSLAANSKKRKRKNPPPPPPPPSRPHQLDDVTGGYDATDPDYALWLPPSDQTGDGSTALNEKLGY